MSGQGINSQRESYSYRSLKNREHATGKVGKGLSWAWGWASVSGPKSNRNVSMTWQAESARGSASRLSSDGGCFPVHKPSSRTVRKSG